MGDQETIAILLTLIVGFIAGYLGQRSGFCSVTGYRDLYLVRDRYLFNGIVGLFLGALGGYAVFQRVLGVMPDFPLLLKTPSLTSELTIVFTVIGGLGTGFFSILAKGCPFRQHVMASEGGKTAMAYLAGFYTGILYFYTIVFRVIDLLFKLVM